MKLLCGNSRQMLFRRYQQQLADNYGCAIVDVRRMKEELPIKFPPLEELPPIYVAGVPRPTVALHCIRAEMHGGASCRCEKFGQCR